MEPKELSKEILEFLDKHALTSADYDPEFDEPEDRFNGPDSASLYLVAKQLEANIAVTRPFSQFGSGCYSSINDKEVKAWHDSLTGEIMQYIEDNKLKQGM